MSNSQIYKVISYSVLGVSQDTDKVAEIEKTLSEGWQILDVQSVPTGTAVVVTVVLAKTDSGMLLYKHFEKS